MILIFLNHWSKTLESRVKSINKFVKRAKINRKVEINIELTKKCDQAITRGKIATWEFLYLLLINFSHCIPDMNEAITAPYIKGI